MILQVESPWAYLSPGWGKISVDSVFLDEDGDEDDSRVIIIIFFNSLMKIYLSCFMLYIVLITTKSTHRRMMLQTWELTLTMATLRFI